jgi:selenophosphate synthetase-related protein
VKRFNIVTEADARVLEYGSTIVLAAGGHVTPLAQDTLRARRVAVVADTPDVDVASLAPVATIKTVAVAGDHTSLALKAALIQHLRGRGVAAHDLGTTTPDAVD